MKRLFFMLALFCLAVASFAAEPRPRSLDKATVLPLALDDAFQFRKTITFLNDPEINKPAFNAMINFERAYINYGAINSFERRQRYGNYYKFFWRSDRKTDLTVRFEYRQSNLGAFVQAKEYTYPAAKGSFESEFKVVGSDYFEDGRVSGWRVLLIENGKIVGLTQSFLWN
jgi:hypothetical protein